MAKSNVSAIYVGTAFIHHTVDLGFKPFLALQTVNNAVLNGVNDFLAAVMALCVHGFLDVGTGVESHRGETPEERFLSTSRRHCVWEINRQREDAKSRGAARKR